MSQYIVYSSKQSGGGGGGAVDSVNGLTGALTLAAGSGITITPVGQTLTIASTGGGTSTLTQNHIFVGNASNVATDVAMSGDATILSSGALTIAALAITTGKIAASAVTNAKLADMATMTVKANKTGGAAAPSDLALSSVTETGSSVLTITNGANSVVSASNLTIQVSQSTTSTSGYLSSTDWNTFNGKQAAGSYITALTGDVTATGPGSVAATVASVGGSSASNVNAATLLANAATSSNAISTIVRRDISGNFAASAVTVTGLTVSGLLANKALQTSGSKGLESSTTTDVELGYVSGVTSPIQSQIDAKLGTSLLQNYILTGSPTNVTQAVAVTGDLTNSNGIFTIASNAITSSKIQNGAVDGVKIASSAVDNTKLANAPAMTLKGNNTGSSGGVNDLSVSTVQSMLAVPTSSAPLALNAGGTGISAGSANAAFNALSPMTLTGDIIVGSSGGAATRLPVGTSGQVLVVSSGTPAWQTVSASGVTTVGTYNSQTPSTDGLVIVGANVYAQSATSSMPGMVVIPSGGSGLSLSGSNAADLKVVQDDTNGTTGVNSSNEFIALQPTEEVITLNSTDITNQYVTLSHPPYGAGPSDNSVTLWVVGGPMQLKGTDYTLDEVAPDTIGLLFAGDLATGGAAELVAGDVLVINYSYLDN